MKMYGADSEYAVTANAYTGIPCSYPGYEEKVLQSNDGITHPIKQSRRKDIPT